MTRPKACACGQKRRGVAAVEFALTLPLVIMLLTGLWEVGRVIEVEQVLANASREASRQAVTGQFTNAQVQQIAINCLKFGLNDPNGTMTGHVVVTVTNLNSPNSDATAAVNSDPIQVIVTIPFNDVRWVKLSLVTSAATVLSGQSTWACLIDQAYPMTTPEPPKG